MHVELDGPARLYLDLLKGCLTRLLFPDAAMDLSLEPTIPFDAEARREGRDWPSEAETMVGLRRLSSLEQCVVTAVTEGVPGDLVETGAWRGGASILMRGTLAALGDPHRRVWVADSFAGLPAPNPEKWPADDPQRTGINFSDYNAYLGVSLETVEANFARYGLLDDRVRFLSGWFKDTLPSAPIERIAVLRLDGDLYESTMEVLETLYDKVSAGGFVVVDDFGCLECCRSAVEAFRRQRRLDEPIETIDWTGVYWRRSR